MRLVWTTDPHLNHANEDERSRWIKEIASHGADGVVISGDISEGHDVVSFLQSTAAQLARPVYFVLGNHDFYRSSIAATRQGVINACRDDPRLCYLTDCSAIELGKGTYLLGEDGWGDATVGDFEQSHVRLNDFQLISDFHQARSSQWKEILQRLGKESAERLREKIGRVPRDAKRLVVVTHVPPFREACWYEGQTTDENWAPFFVCGQVGTVLRDAAQNRRDCQFTVLCGHTHHGGLARIEPNLAVHTGASQYGRPDVEGLITLLDAEFDFSPVRPESSL